jgi:hypothetical protein
MKKILSAIIIVFFSAIITSCANNNGPSFGGDMYGPIILGDKWEENKLDSLTCVAFSDIQYYYNWEELVHYESGMFNYYNELYPLYTNNLIKVSFKNKIYAEITLLDESGNEVYTVIPDAEGNCYLFPQWKANQYQISVKYWDKNTGNEVIEQHFVSNNIVLNIDGLENKRENIDIMFVVDTTASMNDEIEFLKNEIKKVVEEVTSENTVSIRVAILLYKDENELYKTLYSDFTSNIDDQVEFLANKIAYGGGDYEEAVADAMEEAVNKDWILKNSTNILVHFADAPCRDEEITDWYNASLELNKKGIRTISVASSGINKKTEYLMRSMTLITNGTYVYLTNDSRIGDEHMDATVDFDFVVEYLDECLIRLINGYQTGIMERPKDIYKTIN